MQLSFDWPPPSTRLAYRGATPTAVACSRAAAVQAQNRAESQRRRIVALLQARGAEGATDPEIHVATGILRQSICQRRKELRDARPPEIADSGRSRPSPDTGAPCTVWVAADVSGRAA